MASRPPSPPAEPFIPFHPPFSPPISPSLSPSEDDILDDPNIEARDYPTPATSIAETMSDGPACESTASDTASASGASTHRRARGGRKRRRRGGRRARQRAGSRLGTIQDVDDATEAGEDGEDTAKEETRGADTKPGSAGKSPEGSGEKGGKRMVKKTIGDPVPIPGSTMGVPKLQLGLNLDVELELKAKLQGDLSLALV